MGEQNQKMTSTWTHQENHCLYNEYVLILLEEKYFMSMKIPICEKEPQKGCLWYIITLMSDLRFRQRPEWDKAGEDLMASFIILPPSSCSVVGTTARSKGRVENWRLCSCLLRCRTLGFGEGFTTDKMIKPGPGQQYGSPLSLGPYLVWKRLLPFLQNTHEMEEHPDLSQVHSMYRKSAASCYTPFE